MLKLEGARVIPEIVGSQVRDTAGINGPDRNRVWQIPQSQLSSQTEQVLGELDRHGFPIIIDMTVEGRSEPGAVLIAYEPQRINGYLQSVTPDSVSKARHGDFSGKGISVFDLSDRTEQVLEGLDDYEYTVLTGEDQQPRAALLKLDPERTVDFTLATSPAHVEDRIEADKDIAEGRVMTVEQLRAEIAER